jgi:hypothetical protein
MKYIRGVARYKMKCRHNLCPWTAGAILIKLSFQLTKLLIHYQFCDYLAHASEHVSLVSKIIIAAVHDGGLTSAL